MTRLRINKLKIKIFNIRAGVIRAGRICAGGRTEALEGDMKRNPLIKKMINEEGNIPEVEDSTLSFPLILEGTGEGEPGGETAGHFFPATTEANDTFKGSAVEEASRVEGGVV